MSKKKVSRQAESKNPYDLPNPKDAVAGKKLPLDVVPDSLKVIAAMGMLEGALKYGKFNYRARPVRMSVYLAALERHSIRMNNGEWLDTNTKIPHISNAAACVAILADSWLNGTLVDDRPPANLGLLKYMDEQFPLQERLQKLFKGFNPTQYTHLILEAEKIAAQPVQETERRAIGKALVRSLQRRVATKKGVKKRR